MYIVIAKKISSGLSRGFQKQNNHVVRLVEQNSDESLEDALQRTLNDLVNEGGKDNHHEIIQVLWKV